MRICDYIDGHILDHGGNSDSSDVTDSSVLASCNGSYSSKKRQQKLYQCMYIFGLGSDVAIFQTYRSWGHRLQVYSATSTKQEIKSNIKRKISKLFIRVGLLYANRLLYGFNCIHFIMKAINRFLYPYDIYENLNFTI